MSIRKSKAKVAITEAVEQAVVIALRDTAYTQKEIAAMYGISETSVSKINKGYNPDGTLVSGTETEAAANQDS